MSKFKYIVVTAMSLSFSAGATCGDALQTAIQACTAILPTPEEIYPAGAWDLMTNSQKLIDVQNRRSFAQERSQVCGERITLACDQVCDRQDQEAHRVCTEDLPPLFRTTVENVGAWDGLIAGYENVMDSMRSSDSFAISPQDQYSQQPSSGEDVSDDDFSTENSHRPTFNNPGGHSTLMNPVYQKRLPSGAVVEVGTEYVQTVPSHGQRSHWKSRGPGVRWRYDIPK